MLTTSNEDVLINTGKCFPASTPMDWHSDNRSVYGFIFNIPTFPQITFFLCIVWGVLKWCSVWVSFHQDDVTAGECLKSPDIMAREQPFVLLVWLFIGAMDSCLPFSLFHSVSCLFPGLSSQFSYTLSPLFCLKQIHICAVRVMAATSEGSVLGLYLEL